MSVDSNSPLDPRVQVELEKLNSATDIINKFEVDLDEAKSEFQRLRLESVERVKKAAYKLGNSIETAKPYYEARLYASQLARDTQVAYANHEKARSIHAAAKEMVFLAEQGLGEKSTLDMACQEMLSHAASRVNQSQTECAETRNVLKICELKQEVANNRVNKLQSSLKSAIRSSRPYYETRANYNGLLKGQRTKITDLEGKVAEAKATYNEALKNLEQISEEIHRMRKERESSARYHENGGSHNRGECDGGNAHSHSAAEGGIDDSVGGGYRADLTDVINRLDSSDINSTDEYLDFPSQMTIKSSPIRQKKIDKLDCPHLYRDFTAPSTAGGGGMIGDEIEHWTEIRLSNSESSSSTYSHISATTADDHTPEHSSSPNSDTNRKVTCTTVFKVDRDREQDGSSSRKEGIASWLTKSNSLKATGRRQSLDLLIDAGDKVKDVFASGFQKVGKSLERRNSDSEVAMTESGEFFSFRSPDPKEGLSDEQVLNLELDKDNAHGTLIPVGLQWTSAT